MHYLHLHFSPLLVSMMDQFETRLDEGVRGFVHFYDHSSRDYKNPELNANSWREISHTINTNNPNLYKTAWTKLHCSSFVFSSSAPLLVTPASSSIWRGVSKEQTFSHGEHTDICSQRRIQQRLDSTKVQFCFCYAAALVHSLFKKSEKDLAVDFCCYVGATKPFFLGIGVLAKKTQ